MTGCFFLGNIAGAPELFLTEEEANEISEAVKELSKHYPIGMSEKAIAWTNLTFAMGGVFGPKAVAIWKRPRAPRPARVLNIKADRVEPGASAIHNQQVPDIPLRDPVAAKVPSEMWPQSGDLSDDE